MHKITPLQRSKTQAFTLAEVLMAAMITLLVVAGAGTILYQSLRTYGYEYDRLSMNHDIRHFTQQLFDDVSLANTFRLYPDTAHTSLTVGGVTTDAAVTTGQSGEYLVLITTSNNTTTGETTITRLVGYFRTNITTVNGTPNVGVLYRYQYNFTTPIAWITGTPPSTSPVPFYTILANNVTINTANLPIFEPSIVGNTITINPNTSTYASNPTWQNLFYDNLCGAGGNDAVMVQCTLLDQTNPQNVKAIDTYNLTVSPHG